MGGGTTDICLLADKEVISESDSHFQLLASCDGIGVGGNMIDKDFGYIFFGLYLKELPMELFMINSQMMS